MSEALSPHVALITGGGTGIGAAVAESLAADGCAVVLSGRRGEVVEETAARLRRAGARARAVAGDVTSAADAQRMVAAAVEAFGALSIVVNNAGVARGGPIDGHDDGDLDLVVDVNVKGPMRVLRAALPRLRERKDQGGAAVVNVSSSVTQTVLGNYSLYSAAKAAVDQLTRNWALDLAPDRIRVNAVLPGLVETPIFDTMMDDPEQVEAWIAHAGEITPLGRIGRPADVARAVRFLVDPASDWITGTLMSVDGGISTAGNV